jgi:hypothetical protein
LAQRVFHINNSHFANDFHLKKLLQLKGVFYFSKSKNICLSLSSKYSEGIV